MTEDARTTETRRRLIDATIETIRTRGIAAVSARTIAATGKVNQALIFYHFGSVQALLGEASLVTTAERVATYDAEFDAVNSFAGLIEVATKLHAEEHAAGNVNVLAQVLAGSPANPELAQATGQALQMWTDRVEQVLQRLLKDSPIGEALDAKTLAKLVSATFIGLELVGTTNPDSPDTDLAGLERLGVLAELIDDLGPIARRAVRAKLRKA
ncbi:TetR family transcriptional regulator [Aeromicrobium panaciterrae]|uniref:TetR/AcrR family transcriptional regulator n=1 Tax=Aeromicrobium panaciterrae TaxID=363861 RepID=UPI0031DA2027